MFISCCELDNKIEKLCFKIEKHEKLCDLKRKIKKRFKFKNLFFCKNDFGCFDENEEKEIEILDCLNSKKIFFSINLNLIIEIEIENKIIKEKIEENFSLFDLRKKLNINEQYKFYNEMGLILDENEIKILEIIKTNKIKMKKFDEKNFNLLNEDEINYYHLNYKKIKNNENSKNEEYLFDINNNSDNYRFDKYNNENRIKYYDDCYINENNNENNNEENQNESHKKNSNNLNKSFDYNNISKMYESYEIIINGKKYKNLACKSNDLLSNIRNNFFKKFNNLVFLNGKYSVPKDQEKKFKIYEILNNNKLYLKSENNEYNNNINHLDLKKYQKLNIDSVYDYYLYPNYKFNKEEEKICKSLLLVGESGVGKSTFINSLINFIMNVKYSDKHRFKIVNENNNNNNKEFLSQTKEINVYNIKAQNGYPPIKIIDTPGFGDTQGIEYDKKIMSMIFDKFKTINELTSVCIISKSNNTRLTFLEKYIYNNIVKLFSKDLISNFIFLFTFCDNQQPLSLNLFENNSFLNDIIKNIKEPWYLKFNNSGFFSEHNKFTEDFFNLGIDTFKKLINKLKTLKKCSLKLSNEINEKRTKLDNLYCKIKDNLIKLNNNNKIYKFSNFRKNNSKNYIMNKEEKKQIYIDFYNLEKNIENYNNISIKESKENLKEFLDNLIEENNLNKTAIEDLLKNYYEKKKAFLINKNTYNNNFKKFLNNNI